MSNVVQLDKFRDKEPHLTGQCKCFKCQHEWVGVMPVGTENVECPKCGCDGIRVGTVQDYNEPQWQCKCGCFVFRISKGTGPYCVDCGTDQIGWIE